MSSRLGPNGGIVRPSSASRRAAASRVNVIDLTDDDAPGAARPILPNDPHERTSRTDPLLYGVYAHHHYPWRHSGEGESTDFVGIYATLEEAKIAARSRFRREESTADGWEYRWDLVYDKLCLKARLEDYEVDVETLTVSIDAVRLRSARQGMRAEHKIGREAWKEELKRHLRKCLREELENELREELEEVLREELKDELRENLFEELREEVKEVLKEELKEELDEELREELKEEMRDEVKEEMREELDDELRQELKEELEPEVKEELREELISENHLVYVLRVEHSDEGEVRDSEKAGVHLDVHSAEAAVKREYKRCCNNVRVAPDFRADRRRANGMLSYEFVWYGEGEETWNIYLEEKPLE